MDKSDGTSVRGQLASAGGSVDVCLGGTHSHGTGSIREVLYTIFRPRMCVSATDDALGTSDP